MDMPLCFSVSEEPGSPGSEPLEHGTRGAAGRNGVAFQAFSTSIFVTQGRTGMSVTGHISNI